MDLTTTYMGLSLKNPLVASAGPLSRDVDTVRRMEDAGIAAVVMYSLFEEQIIHESHEMSFYIGQGTNTFAEVQSYYPEFETFHTGPEGYLKEIAHLKQAVQIPIIGSLNGISTGGWVSHAKKIEDAGADALELNIYYIPTDTSLSSAEIEDKYVGLVSDIRAKIGIPIAVKLGSSFSSIPNIAQRLVDAGANGLVLFNRFYQPDFDLEALEVVPNLLLSTSDEVRLPLRWIAILYNRVKADFAATSGIHTAEDVIKVLMAGANVAMMTSALLKYGVNHASGVLSNLSDWMSENEYESVTQMRGSMSQKAVENPAAFERANYMKVLNSFGYDGHHIYGPTGAALTASSESEGFMSV